MSRKELIKRVCSIFSKQVKIWGTWGAVYAGQLSPDMQYVVPLVAMVLGPTFEGDNIANFIIETDKKFNQEDMTDVVPSKGWDEFVKSTLINIKDAKNYEQIQMASSIFLDAYTGKIKGHFDAELYIEIILGMSLKEIEFMGSLYNYFNSLKTAQPSISIVDLGDIPYQDKEAIHPLLNRLIAKGVVIESTVNVMKNENNDEDFDISLNESKFYPTSLGYAIAKYLISK